MNIAVKDNSLEIELGENLGEGRDGICYRVLDNSADLTDMVLKVMFESQRAYELLHHIERFLTLKVKRSFCEVPSLECLLITPFISGEDKCCLLMPRAHGKTLMDQETFQDIMSLSTVDRVQIAHQIAMGMKSLHSVGIIHADIAGPNIIINTSQLGAFIIDVDGGGRVNALVPRIKGHHGDWMAPELLPEDSPPPNQFTDCWSLAVVLHEVLTGLSPFYFCSKLHERSKFIDSWPPTPNEMSGDSRKYSLWHHHILSQLQGLLGLFKRAFGSGQNNPKARPTALEWEQSLLKQLVRLPDSKKPCPKCGENNSPELIYCQNKDCATILHRSLHRCSHCSHFVPINALFCPECGAKQIS
jgi:serine/threonine protein kinase